MTQPERNRVPAAALRLYRRLLRLYPAPFRRRFGSEMIVAFRDLIWEASDRPGMRGRILFWCRIFSDLAYSAGHEQLSHWRNLMDKKEARYILPGLFLLIVPVSFIVINVLQYEMGVPIPWNPFDRIYEPGGPPLLRLAADAVIVLGPVAAVGILTLQFLGVEWGGEDRILAIVIRRGSRLAIVLTGVGLLALLILGLYLLGENLPCLLGQQLTC